MSDALIYEGDCLEIMRKLEANSFDLILADPPYFRVKNESWDRQWTDVERFLAWIHEVVQEFARLLKPNGSLFVFASPDMATRVDVTVRKTFEVLNLIRWAKPPYSTKAEMNDKESLRRWFPASESIIFAEHYGADSAAKGEAGYEQKCDELRGFVFEPLRAYFDCERQRSGLTSEQIQEGMHRHTGKRYVFDRHTFSRSQWELPTEEQYNGARACFEELCPAGAPWFRREYEELRREYEELRREYEELRRPFSLTSADPYTDTWTFATVSTRRGKHVCEKPLDLLQHMIRATTKPGALVLDPFCGSGSSGDAALRLGRRFVGIEKDVKWVHAARQRVGQTELFRETT